MLRQPACHALDRQAAAVTSIKHDEFQTSRKCCTDTDNFIFPPKLYITITWVYTKWIIEQVNIMYKQWHGGI